MAKTSKQSDELTSLLAAVQDAGPAGLLECAPSALKDQLPALGYSASGKATKSLRTKLDKLDLWRFVESAAPREVTIPPKGSKKGKVVTLPAHRLNSAGQALLNEAREVERQAQFTALQAELAQAADLREWAAAFGERVSRDLGRLQQTCADGITALSGEIAARVEPVAAKLASIASESPSIAPAASNGVSAEQVQAALSLEWEEIPAVYDRLTASGHQLGPGALRDTLTALSRQGLVQFAPWNRNFTEIRRPEHAYMKDDAKVIYYVRAVDR